MSVAQRPGLINVILFLLLCVKNMAKYYAASSLLESIALEEAAISHILNAEGEKLQKPT